MYMYLSFIINIFPHGMTLYESGRADHPSLTRLGLTIDQKNEYSITICLNKKIIET